MRTRLGARLFMASTPLRRWRVGGMSVAGLVSIVSIVAVLVFISLPRLRGFACLENEADARYVARLLAAELEEFDASGALPLVESLTHRGPVEHALTDTELLEDGRVLRRHGYLFAVVELSPALAVRPTPPGTVVAAEDAPAPRFAVRAWPWEVGRTGGVALVALPNGELFEHENDGPRWSGPRALDSSLGSWGGWRARP